MSAENSKDGSIEKSLLYLSLGTLAIFLVFIASFLWVQNVLDQSQTQNAELTSPTRAAVASLKDGINGLLIRQAQIASTQSSTELTKLGDRTEVEGVVHEAQAKIEGLLPKIVATAGDAGKGLSVDALTGATQRFLTSDSVYREAHLKHWLSQEKLDAKILGIETDLKDFLQSAQGISGKIRFAYGSSVRKINRMVSTTGFDDKARALITSEILRGSSLKNGIVAEILGGAGELNRLAGKIGLVKTPDQLNSLLNNELVQLKERLTVSLEDLAEEVKGDSDSAKIVSTLQTSLTDLSSRIVDPENAESLISLKKAVFDSIKQATTAQEELAKTSAELQTTMGQLVAMSENTSRTFDQALGRAGSQTRILLLIISAVALLAGAFGGRTVKLNLTLLRRQNTDLLRLKGELTTINGDLERLVDERTRAIRTILDHVNFGLMICDESMRVKDGFSKSCTQFFSGKEALQGESLVDLLGLDPRSADHFRATYSQIFDRDFALGDLGVDQLPTRFNIAGRTLGLAGSVVHDAAGLATGVLFCLSDITNLADAEAEVARNRSLIQMLGNRDSFRQFLADAQDGFGEIYLELAKGSDKAARRHLHTLKGNFGMFGLARIAEAIHHLEDEPAIPRDLVAAVENGFKEFLEENRELLGVSYGVAPTESFVVPASLVDAVEGKVKAGKDDLRKVFLEFFRLIRLKRARTFVGPIEEAFAQLAQRLNKKVRFTFTGDQVLLSNKDASVLKCLPHLLRNALDHGIEAPECRGSKPEMASVILTIEEGVGLVQITVEDDGCGLDRTAILRKAVASGLVSAAKADQLSDAEVYRMIFAAGLSTAEAVTDVSGRGVGMGAVEVAVSEAGGTIEISSTPGEGTRFVIKIPQSAGSARSSLAA